jgi:hypothetical protein
VYIPLFHLGDYMINDISGKKSKYIRIEEIFRTELNMSQINR